MCIKQLVMKYLTEIRLHCREKILKEWIYFSICCKRHFNYWLKRKKAIQEEWSRSFAFLLVLKIPRRNIKSYDQFSVRILLARWWWGKAFVWCCSSSSYHGDSSSLVNLLLKESGFRYYICMLIQPYKNFT